MSENTTTSGTDDWHHCHFCGEYVNNGYEPNGTRHWLSDCRGVMREQLNDSWSAEGKFPWEMDW